MQNLDNLLSALAEFETNATREEKKSAIGPLQDLAKRLQIRGMELQMQLWMVTAAESAGDKEMLRALHEHSQHEQVRDWTAEILNLKPQPRTLSCQRIQL